MRLNVSVACKENLGRVFEVINEVCQELEDDPEWGQDMLDHADLTGGATCIVRRRASLRSARCCWKRLP